MFKKLFVGILVCAMLIMPITAFGLDAPQMIKVGLYYGSTRKASYNIGNSAIEVNEGNRKIATINSWGNYTVSAIGTIYTTGIYFSDFSSAANNAAKLSSGFVYYDGIYFYAASTIAGLDATNTLLDSDAVLISCDGIGVFAYSTLRDIGLSNNNKTFVIEGNYYRGQLIIKSEAGKMTAINYVDIEDYLKGVVGKEMSASWEIEALKAQAVVARNFAVSNKKHSSSGFDLCNTTHCQVYGGMKVEATSINEAVESTRGKFMYHNGNVASTYYSSSSGGKTANNEDVWGGAAIPYLRGVDDSYSMGYPNDNWTVTLTPGEIKGALANRGVDLGEIVDVKITKVSDTGRATELTVLGTKGTKVFSKDEIRSSIVPESLKSTFFTITKGDGNGDNNYILPALSVPSGLNQELNMAYTELNEVLPKNYFTGSSGAKKYVINGHGWGHGVGMSQYGAKEMAKRGFSYKEILKYYFTGVEIR